jgi:hypothetical protein
VALAGTSENGSRQYRRNCIQTAHRQQLRQVNAFGHEHLDAKAVLAKYVHQLVPVGMFQNGLVAVGKNGETQLCIKVGKGVAQFDYEDVAQDLRAVCNSGKGVGYELA